MGEGSNGGGSGNSGADDEIERQLRALMDEVETESRLREPSADERQKLADKAQKQARKQQRRTRNRGRGRKAAWSWTVAIIILVGAGTFAYTEIGHTLTGAITKTGGTGGPHDTHSTTGGALPAPATSSALANSGPPSDPFSGTPADNWANGEAGIVIPKAKPVGDFSASRVEDAYETTKKLIVAAALDRQSLFDGSPAPFANLLTQFERTIFLSGLDKPGGVKDGPPGSTRGLIVQFAPGTTSLVTPEIKVRGTMAAAETDSKGSKVLRVSINYIVAYAVEPPHDPADWMRIVADFQGPVDFGDWSEADTPFEPVWNQSPAVAGEKCGMKDGFVHPDFPSGPRSSVPGTGPALDPYSFSSHPFARCGRVTRT